MNNNKWLFNPLELIFRVPIILLYLWLTLMCFLDFDNKVEYLFFLLIGASAWESILFILNRCGIYQISRMWNNCNDELISTETLNYAREKGFKGYNNTTQTTLRKWLIDQHKIYIELIIDGWTNDDNVSEDNLGYRAFIWQVGKPKPHHNDDIGMCTYERILEVALYDALKLIK